MKALCWYGTGDVRVEDVADPKIQDPKDAIVKITSTAICGSDLHLYDGYMPTMEKGDILGHENMGEVVELGSGVTNLKIGDKVVIPFTISCGECFFCQKEMYSMCDQTNPNAEIAAKAMGQSPSGMLGYSHMLGGYAGGQAEYLRVPHADVGPFKVPTGIADEKVLFLSDIFPTGYMAAENCRKGGTVSIPGVYVGFADKIPMGALMNKGLTIRTGQTHVKKYMPLLFDAIEKGEIDPGFIVTHTVPLAEAPQAYEMFKNHDDNCIKVILKP